MMATMISTPNADMMRLMFRHHLAFSYRASSTAPSCFSRSSSIWVWRGLSFPFVLMTAGIGGSGRRAAENHAFGRISNLDTRSWERSDLPGGKINPTAKSNIWAVLLLGAFPSACSSKLGAWNIVRRLLREALLCNRCGDQFGDNLCRGGPLTSVRLSPSARTPPIAKELPRR